MQRSEIPCLVLLHSKGHREPVPQSQGQAMRYNYGDQLEDRSWVRLIALKIQFRSADYSIVRTVYDNGKDFNAATIPHSGIYFQEQYFKPMQNPPKNKSWPDYNEIPAKKHPSVGYCSPCVVRAAWRF